MGPRFSRGWGGARGELVPLQSGDMGPSRSTALLRPRESRPRGGGKRPSGRGKEVEVGGRPGRDSVRCRMGTRTWGPRPSWNTTAGGSREPAGTGAWRT